MSFVHFKMALARLTIVLFVILYIQGIHGQQSGLISAPTVGQNSLNQVHQINQGTTQENSIQKQNGNPTNKATNLNAQVPVNFQSLNPQATISTQSTLLLQQPQRTTQPINIQLSQIPNFQQAFTVQPSLQFDASFLQQLSQQSGGVQQQKNLPQSQNVYRVPVIQQIPCTKQLNSQRSADVGDFNTQKQLPITSSVVKPNPVQPSEGISIVSFASSPVSAIPSRPCQRTGNINNLEANNYFPTTTSAFSVIETPQISIPYSTLPVMAVLPPAQIPLVTQSVLPYGNPDILESPLRISNNFFIEDENKDLNEDHLTTLLLSLLQSSKKSSNSAMPMGYSENPYLSPYLNQVSKPSTIKTLLPLILNILTERREGCRCRAGCQNCEQKNKNKDTEPIIYDGYSKKRDYSIREEIFQKDVTEAEVPRMVREHTKSIKVNKSIPVDSCEDEDTEYNDCSEEDED